MAKTICKAVKAGEAPRRGKPSIEWYKNGKPQYYCYGWKNSMTDELLEVCRNCKDNVIYAQDDLDEWNKERRGAREKEINPLSEYSTSQLKAELRRRKNERQ